MLINNHKKRVIVDQTFVSVLMRSFQFTQGLYPGYIMFFVQSALMIAGSRGKE